MSTAWPPPRGIDSVSAIRVLIAEDEAHLGMVLEHYLSARGFAVTMVRNGREALNCLRAESFDVALLDVVMPELDGLEVLRRVREEPLPPEIIVITGNGTIETALAALKLGAYDFLSKPYRMAEIDMLVRRAWEKRLLTRDNRMMQTRLERSDGEPVFVTAYAPLLAVMALAERIASSDSPVLIGGEVGTGKRLVARVLHHRGKRSGQPFIALNGATRAGARLDIELFGAERGAIAGAVERTIGAIELAAGGTLFLSNVGEMDLAVQERVAQMLDEGTFTRVGGTRAVELRARLVGSTTRDLSRVVATGGFRNDLQHRLSAARVALPPLRERLPDVLRLADHFLAELGGTRPPSLSGDALVALERYRWPGNVRELRNVMDRAVMLSTDGSIHASDLPLSNEPSSVARAVPAVISTLAELERRHIVDVLQRTQWHQGRSAELLGISPKTLYRKIREFGLRRPANRS